MIEGYSRPMSVAPGDTIEFKVSSSTDFDLVVLRLNPIDSDPLGEQMSEPEHLTGTEQPVPPGAGSSGCGWNTTKSLTVPNGWRSGIYSAQCTATDGSVAHLVFVVKPGLGQRGDIAALANLNTWNAYNGWPDGVSKYQGATEGSFERPFPSTIPSTSQLYNDFDARHLTRAELWVLNWLEEWYVVDVYADQDMDAGIQGLSDYKALLLNTHPEYWTLAMWDHLVEYLDGGGSVHYLAGNGVFERCEYNGDRSALTFWGGVPPHDLVRDRPPNYFRNLPPPRPERGLLGVAFRNNNHLGVSNPSPLAVLDASHRFFDGTIGTGGGRLANGDLIGLTGRNHAASEDASLGAASGWEMDTSLHASAADGEIVNAWEPGRPTNDGSPGTDRGNPPANLQLLARGTNHSDQGNHAADMTYYGHPGGGFVFAVGSITFGGSLIEDANLQQIVLNAVDESLGWVDPKGTLYAPFWEQAAGPAWQGRHGLTAEQHQQTFDELTRQGYRLVGVNGYGIDGDAYYASIWEQREGPAWQARHGLTAEQHQQTFDELTGQGYRLVDVSGYGVGSDAFYASIWEQREGPAWQARHGLTAEQHQQTFDELTGQGYRLVDVSGYGVGSDVLYASIWEQREGPLWQARHGITAARYQREFNLLARQGYRLRCVSGYRAA